MTNESKYLKTPKFSPEVREGAVRMVGEHRSDHASQWAAIVSIAAKIGCTAQTLSNWVRQTERDCGKRPGTTTDDPERLSLSNGCGAASNTKRSTSRPTRASARPAPPSAATWTSTIDDARIRALTT